MDSGVAGWPRPDLRRAAAFRIPASSSSPTMLEMVWELRAVSRAISARDSAPLIRTASMTTRRLCDFACSRLVPATVAVLPGGVMGSLVGDYAPPLKAIKLDRKSVV